MVKKGIAFLLAALLVCGAAGCGIIASKNENPAQGGSSAQAESESPKETGADQTESAGSEEAETDAPKDSSAAENTIAAEKTALLKSCAGKFQECTFEDPDSWVTLTYNLYLPEGYKKTESYPMVVFLADARCVGKSPKASLKQGLGALVFASEEWQSENPTIIAVPTYPENFIPDPEDYDTPDYLAVTNNLVQSLIEEYAVDPSRVYGTGQGMGGSAVMLMHSTYPDLFAACLFAEGDGDPETLHILEDQTFVSFAAEDDAAAWKSMQDMMAKFDTDSIPYKYVQWDGSWSQEELSKAAKELFTPEETVYFISWTQETIPSKNGKKGGYRVAAFDYAYHCPKVLEWMFKQ